MGCYGQLLVTPQEVFSENSWRSNDGLEASKRFSFMHLLGDSVEDNHESMKVKF